MRGADTEVGRLTIRWSEVDRVWECWDGARVIEASPIKAPLVTWAKKHLKQEREGR